MVTREHHADKRYGLGRSLAPLIEELTRRNIEVAYLCQADAGNRSLAALRSLHGLLVKLFGRFFTKTQFIPLLWGIFERINMGRLAAKVMAKQHYTHVHCHDPIIAAGYRWFARLRLCHTARWGITQHGFGSYAQAFHDEQIYLGTRVMRWLRRWETKILLKAHWVIIPTHSSLKQLERDLSIYPIPKTWQVISHSCSNLNYYSKPEARQRLGWSTEDIYIIAVGRFIELKQFPVLIQACAHLQYPSWKLVLIGEGDHTPLQTLATDLGINEHLDFAISDDMGLYYSAADIYISTSLTESFGLANLEALFMGLPSICTAVGAVPEVLGSGARLVPAQNTFALVEALQTLLENADTRQYWAQQARKWAQNYPDVSAITDAYIAIYQDQALPELTKQLTYTRDFWQDLHQQVNKWQACPLPKSLDLPQDANILVIAPHSDDECFGCGGTLALLKQKDCNIKVVIMTDGSKGDPLNYANGNVINCRQKESIAALNILGIDDIVFLDETDGNFQYTTEIAKKLSLILDDFVADWIFLPSTLDYHRDHIAVSLSVLNVWQQRGYRERVFLYEIWEPVPATWIVNVSKVVALKQQAMQCYQLPLKYGDYSAAITAIMRYRGFYFMQQSEQYAEAFIELEATSWRSVLSQLFNLRSYQESVL